MAGFFNSWGEEEQKRAFLVVLLLAIVVFILFWQLSYRPQRARILQKEKQVQQLLRERDQKRKIAAQLDKYRAEMEEVRKKLAEVAARLPEEKEIPMLLKTISFIGKGSGLDIEAFQPKGEANKEFYAEVPFEISLTGSYHQIGMFFYQVGRLPRVVSIRDFSLSPASENPLGSPLLKAQCLGLTYYFLQAPEEGKASEGKGKKGK